MKNIRTGKMRCAGMGCPDRFPAGYTLIEMLTVMAIIAVLSTLVLSAVVNVKHRAQEVKCMNNLKQIAISTRFYLDDFVNPPRNLLHLHETGYLPNSGVLDCPNDVLGNWG
ncbi:MAG: prepilin-type N-terminal cleavage/methylation domain-containing protein, partial [Verrucomicrobia bacterium]|nr:prepilin-type N-terminal cleavage/methylation domain-containing protein [Verrucomicrobiota bacterium]